MSVFQRVRRRRPANKHGELGTMDATSTKFCECVVKATADLVLEDVESRVFA
jgi:hypothetical protein